ncbi:MAG: amidohydrolase family protein, partial [Cloacibacillus sp.]
MNKFLIKGKVWTGEPSSPYAQAFFTENDKITKVGSVEDVEKYAAGMEYEEQDFKDNLIIPGISDAHIHATAYAKQDLYLDLSGVTKLEDIIPIIEQKATELPEDQWIRAMNFNEANWAVPIKPDLKFMDSLNVKNPV